MLENDKWYGEKSIWEVEWEVRRVGGRQHAFLMGWMGKPFGKMALKERLKRGSATVGPGCSCGRNSGYKAPQVGVELPVSRAGRTPVRLDVSSTVLRGTAPNCVGPPGRCTFTQERCGVVVWFDLTFYQVRSGFCVEGSLEECGGGSRETNWVPVSRIH